MREGAKTIKKAVIKPPRLLLKSLPTRKAATVVRAIITNGEIIAAFMKDMEKGDKSL
jgi:hypothetical protein